MTTLFLCSLFQIFVLIAVHNSFSVDASKKSHDQQGKIETVINGPLILNEMLLDYDTFARPPSLGGSSRVQVQVAIRPTYVAWKDDQLRTSFSMEQSWMDERLKFMGEKELKINDDNSRLWLPDTVFRNSVDNPRTSHGLITIQPRGLLRWTQQVLVSFPCPLDPADVWSHDGILNCTLTLSSRGYAIDDLEYAWSPNTTSSAKMPNTIGARSSQLQKMEFLNENAEAATESFNATTNQTIFSMPVVKKQNELSIVFTVQTEFTKSVLRYLTKKAMKDL